MVSGRRLNYGTTNGTSNRKNIAPKHADLESGRNLRLAKFKFRDAVFRAVEGDRVHEFKKKLKEEIDGHALEKFRRSQNDLKKISNKQVRKFYEDQNQRLNDWLEVDALVMSMADDVLDSMNPADLDHDGFAETGGALQREHESVEHLLPQEERERRIKSERKAKWAININVIANVLLLGAKIIAAFYSSSLSLIASLVDSALDLLCTLIVWSTNKLVNWRLQRLKAKFPVGRRRLEPLGILVFSILMIVSFLQILQESVQKLLPGGEKSAVALPAIAIGAMASTIGIKGIIWFGCMPIKTTQVQALAQDCKTDVIFNTLSLLFPIIGSKTDTWWLDPVGAALLSLFIIYDWSETCIANVTRLTGAAADDNLLRKITYLAYRFSPLVGAYKSIKAYHAGDGVWVEVDLLVDGESPLNRAHDIAETLQYCLEGLTEVDRAFVTVDYTSQGPTGHNSEQ
ncbi:hypothetical protein EJ05DRAFT_471863 [Pseudovirgaria hyperparasitica]|uniref:Cation efflux protein transmembrane domain-containing protein n=1 Tax=Pseudovirgaria hyperparasitica TaxID=470096 RepID=A0A6A6WL36_9PEZI|nr:uncharacterized protein EJ05DRAFT_471863 [Pseudovirgaria hyperparasitica]KAF2762898.1 hypothetical protein EJ05DRAFT_471863 [Pseudovirgaria hyperparasitica]